MSGVAQRTESIRTIQESYVSAISPKTSVLNKRRVGTLRATYRKKER